MADHKFVGQNYQTPDIVAKVTGRAKYSEDFRAEGMLFHMPGHWEMYFDITQGGRSERAQVDVDLK